MAKFDTVLIVLLSRKEREINMKKILVPVVIALATVNVNAKGKWDAPYVTSKEESGITRNVVCEKKDCVETITIPENFKDKELTIKPSIFYNENYVSMPGDTRNFSLKIINLSNNDYTYQDNSLYLKPIEDTNNYLNLISYNNAKIPKFATMYRLYNSEPLKALFANQNLTDEQLKDESIVPKLKELGYTNGIQYLDKYYVDYFNNKYHTKFTCLEDLTDTYIGKIWTNISKRSTTLETNNNLIEFQQNYFYNVLLTMKYNDKTKLDDAKYSIGAYSRKEQSYQDLNKTFLEITIPKTSETSLEPFSFHLNGPLTRNSYMEFTYGVEVGLSFDKVLKYGNVYVYYIDTLGNLLTDKITMRDEVGKAYATEEKSFDGYKLVRVDGQKEGTFIEGVQEVYYMYDIDNTKTVDNIVPSDDIYTGVKSNHVSFYALIVSLILLIGAKIKYARK